MAALSGCHDREGGARAPSLSAANGEPLAPPPVVSVTRHRQAPPKRSETVLVVAPEYPPPIPADVSELAFWLYTPYITKGSRFEVGKLDGIARSSCFVTESGTVVAARGAEPRMLEQETAGHRFALYPSSALAPDRWYALLIHADDFLRVQEGDAAPPPGAQKVSIWPFFTGSAPRVVAAHLDDDAEHPSLELGFSEPLKVTSELCSVLAGSARDPNDRDCESMKGTLSSKVHLALRSAAASEALTLTLPASARGNGRSFAEGRTTTGCSDLPAGLALKAADLEPCGKGRCWREPLPPELASIPSSCR